MIIVMTSMYLGGAERSLLGLLEAFDYEKYDVSLFLLDHSGELLKYIPEQVHLLPENPRYKALEGSLKNAFSNGQFAVGMRRLYGKFKGNRYARRFRGANDIIVNIEYKQKYAWKIMPMISDETYDLAISFMTPHYVTAKRINAKKKIAWVHTDYTKMHLDAESEVKMWDLYDYIATVSEGVKKTFCEVFPSLASKVIVVENILPETMIRQQAEEEAIEMYDEKNYKIVSIGRFTYQKNFDHIPAIMSHLKQSVPNVKWYIIGFGGDEQLINEKILEHEVGEEVVVLGKKVNPYPYIKACDLYVQPSRYEGKAVTVREAQMLGKPVVITDFTTAASQLENGIDGIIVPMNDQLCAQGIADLLLDRKKWQELSDSCKARDYTNKTEVNKLNCLMTD